MMERFTVVVPYCSNGDAARDRALGYVLAHYRHQPVELYVEEGAPGTWSKGAVLHAAMPHVHTTGIVIADGDVLVSAGALERSLMAVVAGATWSMPHGIVYRLNRRATSRVIHGQLVGIEPLTPSNYERRPHPGPPGGGIVVTTRDAWECSGGIDPRFTTWGGEDISFARALDTLAGPGVHFDAPMWHLWHRPMPRRAGNRASEENERLAARYAEAVGDRAAMRAATAMGARS